MSYNAFSNNSITSVSNDTFRTNSHCYKFTYSGLRPNTKHKMYLDGSDYTWACRGFGQNLGEDLLSNNNGQLTVYVLYEIPFSKPAAYEIKEKDSVAFYTDKFNTPNGRMEDTVHVQWKKFEIQSADGLSHAETLVHFHTVLVNADYNKIEQHD